MRQFYLFISIAVCLCGLQGTLAGAEHQAVPQLILDAGKGALITKA